MRIKKYLATAMAVFLSFSLFACTKGSSAPGFISDESDPQASVAAPDVNENLAKETGQEKLIYHVGPIDLMAGQSVDTMLDRPLTMRFQTDKAVWVTGFAPKIVDSTGNELPSELLHRAILSNMHEENPLCAGTPNPFAIATSDLVGVELPNGYGYPILSSDPLEATAVLKNNSDKDYIDVYFEIALDVRPMSEMAQLKDVKPMLIELDPCGHSPMDAAPNQLTKKNATYQIGQNFKLIAALGALQDFGSYVELTTGADIMPFWRAEAILDTGHKISGLTGNPFEDSDGIPFKAGDRITIGVSYDNASDKWLKGATAEVLTYMAVEE